MKIIHCKISTSHFCFQENVCQSPRPVSRHLDNTIFKAKLPCQNIEKKTKTPGVVGPAVLAVQLVVAALGGRAGAGQRRDEPGALGVRRRSLLASRAPAHTLGAARVAELGEAATLAHHRLQPVQALLAQLHRLCVFYYTSRLLSHDPIRSFHSNLVSSHDF